MWQTKQTKHRRIISRTVVNFIVPLHQTTANLHPAVGSFCRCFELFGNNWCSSDEDWRVESRTYWLGRFLNIWNTLDKSVARGVAKGDLGWRAMNNFVEVTYSPKHSPHIFFRGIRVPKRECRSSCENDYRGNCKFGISVQVKLRFIYLYQINVGVSKQYHLHLIKTGRYTEIAPLWFRFVSTFIFVFSFRYIVSQLGNSLYRFTVRQFT